LRESELTRESFAWLIGSLCQINRVPFDAALLLQRFPAPHSLRQFREALQSLSFKVGDGALERAACPCVGFLKSGEPALLAKIDGERALYFKPGTQAPETAPADRLEPGVILVRHEARAALRDDGAEPAARFGFRWFWNELARHKRIWRDVLLASLFIQLLALAPGLEKCFEFHRHVEVVFDRVLAASGDENDVRNT